MSEIPSSPSDGPQLPEDLYALKRVWNGLNVPQKTLILGRIYNSQRNENNGKNDFVMKAVRILGMDVTLITMLVDTYEHLGENRLIDYPGRGPEDTAAQDDQQNQSGKKKTDSRAKRDSKKKKTLLSNSLHIQLSADEAAELYKDLKDNWDDWPVLKRAIELRRLFQFESTHLNGDELEALKKLRAKIRSLKNEEVIGYLELFSHTTGLKTVANKEVLTGDIVKLIGRMRVKFGELFDPKRVAGEISKVLSDKTNLTDEGLLKTEAFMPIFQALQETHARLHDLKPGETYVIDPDSPFAKEYEGVADEEFEIVPPDDPVYSKCYRYQSPPAEKVLCRNKDLKNRVVFIDCRALCRPSDVRKGYY